MKSRLLLTIAMMCCFAISCNEQNDVKPKKTLKSQLVEITSLKNEPQLQGVLNVAGFNSQNGLNGSRQNSGGNEIDVNEILKIVQEDSVHHTYTFKIQNDLLGNFSNLVIEEAQDGSYLAFILTYEFEGQFVDLDNYSGKITRFDLDGNFLREIDFLNGEMVSDQSRVHAKASQNSDCLTGSYQT